MQDAAPLQLNFTSQLLLAGRHWQQIANATLTRYGISLSAGAVLLQLHRHGEGVNQVALANFIGIEGASLVRTLDSLCEADLIRRGRAEHDHRVKTLWFTDRGKTLTAKTEAELTDLRTRIFLGVPVEAFGAALSVFDVLEQVAQQAKRTGYAL